MKVLLINPNRTYARGSKGVNLGLPLGLLYVAASLEEQNISVALLDCLLAPETSVRESGDLVHFGIAEEAVRCALEAQAPDVVGIGCPFSAQWTNALTLVSLVRQSLPKASIVLGGPHASVAGYDILKGCPEIDFVIAGEGEQSFPRLVRALASGEKEEFNHIPGLMFRSLEGSVCANPVEAIIDLDSLPLPAYHLIDLERLFESQSLGLFARPNRRFRSVSIITSRGCPYTCTFCSIHLSMGRKWRFHSVEHTLRHIRHLVEKLGVRHLHFEDDNFTFKRQRAIDICGGIVEQGLHVTWDTPNGVRADTLNDDLVELAKKSGCQAMVVAAESGDQEVVNTIVKKAIRLDSIERAAQLCKKHGIHLSCFFVIGFPGETRANIRKTIDFAYSLFKRYDCHPNLMVATPLPGTELAEIAVRGGLLVRDMSPGNLATATSARGFGMIATAEFDPDYLQACYEFLQTRIRRVRIWRAVTRPKHYPALVKSLGRKASGRISAFLPSAVAVGRR